MRINRSLIVILGCVAAMAFNAWAQSIIVPPKKRPVQTHSTRNGRNNRQNSGRTSSSTASGSRPTTSSEQPATSPHQETIITELFNKACDAYYAKDYSKALEYFQKAADKGDSESMCYLGLMHYYGYGTKCANGWAAYWFRLSADKGDTDAMVFLGQMYENGHIDDIPNETKAKIWYQEAADKGNALGLIELERLENGDSLFVDPNAQQY